MPIIWRHLLKNYIKIFLLSIFVFISLLILMRMQEIARFATLGTSITTILLFILYQFPLILPLAIPISALIASTLLISKLSSNHELTSLRAQGLGIKEILYPLKLLAILLAFINFVVASELTPQTKLKSKNLIYKATAHNPLLLLRLNKLTKVKNSYSDLNIAKNGKCAHDMIFAFVNPKSSRLNLILADQLQVEDQGILIGDHVSFLSHLPSKNPLGYDHLVLENYDNIRNSSLAIASLLHESDKKRVSSKQLRIKPLIIKLFVEKSPLEKKLCISEISRRAYLALITYLFVLLGALYSIQVGRQRNKKSPIKILALSATALSAYLAARGVTSHPLLNGLIFILPTTLILTANQMQFKRVERGIE